MIRAFAAIALPEAVRFDLMLVQQGMPVPRVLPPENLHLTLLFLGEVSEPVLEDIDLSFRRLRLPGFTLEPSGLGLFGGARPHVVYAGVSECGALRQLQGSIVTAARGVGQKVEARKFVPHVTLARLPGRRREPKLEIFVAERTRYRAPRFDVTEFCLYRSHLGASGAHYQELARYPLVEARDC